MSSDPEAERWRGQVMIPAMNAPRPVAIALLALACGSVSGVGCGAKTAETPATVARPDSVWIEELTSTEVGDAIRAGKTTVILATGSTEESGPYVPTGKHQYVLRATTDSIARRLGNALVAPLVPFEVGAPSAVPGDIGLRLETFESVVQDLARGLAANGFRDVVLLGDSGGDQAGLSNVAQRLTAAWGGAGPRVHYVKEYYESWEAADAAWASLGVRAPKDAGVHDDYSVEAILAAIDPDRIRLSSRSDAGKATINGQTLLPLATTAANGRKLIELRAAITSSAIRKAIGP